MPNVILKTWASFFRIKNRIIWYHTNHHKVCNMSKTDEPSSFLCILQSNYTKFCTRIHCTLKKQLKRKEILTEQQSTKSISKVCQSNLLSSKPVTFASRTTVTTEQPYTQLDLHAMCLNYIFQKFRKYLIGYWKTVILVTKINLLYHFSLEKAKHLSRQKESKLDLRTSDSQKFS